MGDQRMAEIRTGEGSLYFYTHTEGRNLVYNAVDALELALPRKGDNAYALRRIVDHLIYTSNSRDNELNSGLMLAPSMEDRYGVDPFKPSVLIDLESWTVSTPGQFSSISESLLVSDVSLNFTPYYRGR